jgi:tetratricopeptide (TPR) repeat protein
MSRDSQADQAALRAVQAAAQAGQHERAAVLAQTALAGGLEHPLLYNVVALSLENSGRVVEAERLLRRALQVAPGDLGSRNALGLCLLRLERPAEALEQFDELLAANPLLPFLHASRGTALFRLGRIRDAEAGFERAIELDSNQPVALAGLANLASSRGAFAAAKGWAERALGFLPGYPDAVLSLAAAELGLRDKNGAEARIRGLLSEPRLAPLERAYANGLLGDVLDSKNQADEAFEAYTRCNRELREVYAASFAGEVSALQYVRSMTQYFQGVAGAAWKGRTPADRRITGAAGHVFLLGFPRSGTTLLEVILEGHPGVASLEENESLIDAVREFMQRPEDLDRLARAPEATLDAFRAAYWRLVGAAGVQVSGKQFVDKHPLNTLKLPLIARLFPDAKILFAARDPRDIVLSCFRHRFRMSAPIFELLTVAGAARYYDAVMRLTLCLTGILPLEFCMVRHEDVVTGFRREMQRLCEYLNLEWVEAMGDFALRTQKRAALTPSTAQLVRGLSTEGLGQWHRYRRHLEPVLPLLAPWAKQFLYEAS